MGNWQILDSSDRLVRNPREQRFLIDEADRVTKRVSRPEHAFSPRHFLNAPLHDRTAGIHCQLVGCIEIRDSEINILPRMLLPTLLHPAAIGHRVVASKYSATAIEVVSARRYALAGHPQHQPVKRLRLFDVSDRKDDTKEPRDVIPPSSARGQGKFTA